MRNDARLKGQVKREREAARNRLQSAASREIGPLREVEDLQRREATRANFRLFCETYLPAVFDKPFCADHLKAIARIENAVLRGGLFALAMPRGSGKTVLCISAAIWAIVHGHREFITLIGATEAAAVQLLGVIKAQLSANELLAADFPEVCQPIAALEGDARRCAGQTLDGERTAIGWTNSKVVLPTVAGSRSSGAIITVCGLTGRLRGQNHTLPDGRIVRPSLAIIDDPQTSDSAASEQQTRYRCELLQGDVLGLAGPGRKIAALMPCTVIKAGDLADKMLDRQANPDWQGERCRMLYSEPVNEKLWAEYAVIRGDSMRAGNDGAEATEFYRKNREAMDAGAIAAWPERFNPDELSAVQHAMNLKIRDAAAFAAEYQNEPAKPETAAASLDPQVVTQACNGIARGTVPTFGEVVTAFIDVHGELLFYTVAAWGQDFTGAIIDYGTWPEQKARHFTLRKARPVLSDLYPSTAGVEGCIAAGLQDLVKKLAGTVWTREDGAELRIGRMMIDAGFQWEVVTSFCRRSQHAAILLPSKGIGIGASSRPLEEYDRTTGDLIGNGWWIPKPKNGVRHVRIDVNRWKSWIAKRFAAAVGGRGGITLFGNRPHEHELYASHLTAEYAVQTFGHGRQVEEWKPKPNTDNHWLDTLVGCAAAASLQGITPGQTPAVSLKAKKKRPRRNRVSYFSPDLRR